VYFCKSQKIRIKRHLIITRLVRASRVRSVQDSCCPRFAMSLARFGHVTFTVARPTNRVREVRHVPSQVAPSSRSATRLARYPKPQIFQHASRAGSPHVTADAPPMHRRTRVCAHSKSSPIPVFRTTTSFPYQASRSRGRNTSSRRPSRGSQVTPINSFLKGLFGGVSADADVSIDPNPKVAVDVKQSVTVTLQRPMGLVLEPLTEKKKGAVITELVDDGNADRSGLLQVGDILVSCSFQNSPECLLGEESWYENIVDELAGETSCSTITLVIQRTIFEDNEDMLTRTADAKRYWEEKRYALGFPKLKCVSMTPFNGVNLATKKPFQH
jgi:hypothetical protein